MEEAKKHKIIRLNKNDKKLQVTSKEMQKKTGRKTQ
jgi:hypothetical protein